MHPSAPLAEFVLFFMTKSICCQSKRFLKSVRILDLTPESFRIRRELQESGPKISVEILGVEFLTFEVGFRILVPQTYMENMKKWKMGNLKNGGKLFKRFLFEQCVFLSYFGRECVFLTPDSKSSENYVYLIF